MHPEYHEDWDEFPDEWYEDVDGSLVDCHRLFLSKCFELPCYPPNTEND